MFYATQIRRNVPQVRRIYSTRYRSTAYVRDIFTKDYPLFFSVETENGLEEEDVASYACYRSESNGDRSESIRRNGDDQEPVSFMVLIPSMITI